MGRRTDAILDLIRFLRTTKPKYSFEVLIFNIVVGLAAVACSIRGETLLWLLLFAVLWISLGIQWFRVRRVIKQMRQDKEWLKRMLPRLEQAIANYERAMTRPAPRTETAQLITLLKEDIEQAQQREADRDT